MQASWETEEGERMFTVTESTTELRGIVEYVGLGDRVTLLEGERVVDFDGKTV